ncbi:transcriptional regulator [Streptomyces armeniacus]|uniref:Transcriptional regulator n=1 Tax=Streptomyces armeniacus TaxID=83291 RepID=A0A345XY28_9ACTN|nr:helix-turn-helix domain-containing protein [Streptomyces armeniacus]AXK36544.1 transcriptional regulator [Streptomyces armeniacus]
MGATEFAQKVGELKARSGLSYGALAKRLHMSTSTVHRYVNGTAVPVEFAPVERLARACKATPEEVVELHRLWILADAARRRPATGAPEEAPEADTPAAPTEPSPPTEPPEASEGPEAPEHAEPAKPTDPRDEDEEAAPEGEPVTTVAAPAPVRPARRRLVAIASGVAAAVAVLAIGAGATLVWGGDDGGNEATSAAPEKAADEQDGGEGSQHGEGSKRESPDGAEQQRDRAQKGGEQPQTDGEDADQPATPGGTPVTARVRPYTYEDPCSQHFLVNQDPAKLPQPPAESQAPSWVRAFGAVPADQQLVEITLQGTGSRTVVLENAQVRVAGTRAPLAWNKYATGIGCGGKVSTKSFTVNLDSPQPAVAPVNGQQDFPYKVSESDPEVFYVKADVADKDVTWYLELEWSSGSQHGVLRIDDQGRPFRTSGSTDRPQYEWPTGGDRWEPSRPQ